MKTLVVDNNPVVIKLVQKILEMRGHEVRSAIDGFEALKILEETAPDLIFCDLVMPKISGDKLCRKIRSLPHFESVPIIILSAIAAEDDIDVRTFGANACIAKGPYNLMEKHILSIVEEVEKDQSSELPTATIGIENVHLRSISKELLSAKNHSESILRNLAEGIIELTGHDQIVYANSAACEVCEQREEDLLASSFFDIFEIYQRDAVAELLGKARVSGMTRSGETPLMINGRQISLSLVSVEDEEAGSTVAILDDITEFKKTEEELEIRANQQAAVAALGRRALVGSDIDDFMQEAVDQLASILKVELVAVFEVLRDRESILLRRGIGWKSGLIGTATLPVGVETQAAFTLRVKESVVVRNLKTETRFSQSAFLQAHNVTSGMSVLIAGSEMPWGVLGVYSLKERRFSENDVYFVQAVGNLLADAIHATKAFENRIDLEKQVRISQKFESLGLLAGGIAHDFNNLLLGILGNAEMARAELEDSPEIREKLESIEFAGRQAAHLCHQMLAYAGKNQLVVDVVDLSELVRKMFKLFKVSIPPDVDVDLRLADRLPPAEVDSSQITQVVMNLVLNAVDAIGDRGGRIVVRTGVVEWDAHEIEDMFRDRIGEELEPGSFVFLQVVDDGVGMDQETQQRIFEPFFSTKAGGHGLGLSAVQGIVRAHKGIVKFYSSRERGTTFKVFLPTCEGKVPAESAANTPMDPVDGTGTILLVDDEPIVRKVATKMLKRMNFDVICVGDGQGALAQLNEHKDEIVLILLDLTMSHMDGVEVARKVRAMGIDVPIILSSGHKEQKVLNRLRRDEYQGFIQKPYGVKPLRDIIFGALGHKAD